MESILEFVKMALPAAAGGGLIWLFTLRARIRRGRNETYEADFTSVSKVVRQAMDDLNELSQRVGELEVEKAKLMQEFGRLRAENESLIQENRRLSAAVRQYMLQQNPNLLKP